MEELVKKIKKQEKIITHQDKSKENKVKHYESSCFIKEKGVFVKGEFNYSQISKRKAMILLFKEGTDQIIGKIL